MTNETSADHSFVEDPRNEHIKIGIRDGVSMEFNIYKREDAKISVFDSSVLLGDGVWEGLRAYQGKILYAKEHLTRLFEASKTWWIDIGCTKSELLGLIHQTLDANEDMNCSDEVHIRLIVSRGLKKTPYQSKKANIGKALIIIIPEFKRVDIEKSRRGMRLVTSHIRRGNADTKDEMWNHLSKATDVAASISAEIAGADGVLMLDRQGFVKTCNATNFFCVKNGEIWAPTRNHQMHGITRQKVIDIATKNNFVVREFDFTLSDVYNADEAFCTGTFGSQITIREIDGHDIGCNRFAITEKLQQLYKEDVKRNVSLSRAEIAKTL